MPGSYTEVTSSSQLSSILSSHRSTIIDFHATWCGSCHAIAPVFEQLSTKHAAKGKFAFVKVDTDQNQDIVSKYGISAYVLATVSLSKLTLFSMPTFLIFNGTSVTETIRGANASVLRAAVAKAADAAGAAGGAVFESKGYRLGSDEPAKSTSKTTVPDTKAPRAGTGSGGRKLGAAGSAAAGPSLGVDIGAAADSLVRFMGLYLVTLLSLDPYNAAENSPLSVRARR
jgi:thioredoxin 1